MIQEPIKENLLHKEYKKFKAEIAEEVKKLKFENCKDNLDLLANLPISKYFEWDGTSTPAE